MGSGGRFLKAFFGAGLICLLLFGMLESGETRTKPTLERNPRPAGSPEHAKVAGMEKLDVRPVSDLNYMSKRRVPNGPDPIHNRRAGNSGRPPGQA
ncbi:hypothetical protein RJ640_029511 [Escallonia rubra]|uniref:CLAVATA3/ESR (CLE)-related protein 25 n=1 Tax=Escallonia rubra TaxID=112253 RepID=A0AA88UTV5_9ASTE|nr:hypothetical protein RJ640_029511 [Escallonia rubra]